ncbi:MAG: glycosyltransferase family 2 protein [bacterium]
MIDLSISIVSWNCKDLLRKCLKSIYENTSKISYEVFVVDNASADGSADMVAAEFPKVTLFRRTGNDGFTVTNNQAIRASKGRYIILLNPDTIVKPGALDTMVKFMDEHPDAGALGPKLLNPDGTLQRSCLSFPNMWVFILRNLFIEALMPWNPITRKYLMTDFDHDHIAEVDQPMGAALMVRREPFGKVGLLDEKIHIFFDDVDWCYRIKKAGFKIYFTPEAHIIHYGGASVKKWTPFKLSKEWNKSRDYYIGKHYSMFSKYLLWVSDLLKVLIILAVVAVIIGLPIFLLIPR